MHVQVHQPGCLFGRGSPFQHGCHKCVWQHDDGRLQDSPVRASLPRKRVWRLQGRLWKSEAIPVQEVHEQGDNRDVIHSWRAGHHWDDQAAHVLPPLLQHHYSQELGGRHF